MPVPGLQHATVSISTSSSLVRSQIRRRPAPRSAPPSMAPVGHRRGDPRTTRSPEPRARPHTHAATATRTSPGTPASCPMAPPGWWLRGMVPPPPQLPPWWQPRWPGARHTAGTQPGVPGVPPPRDPFPPLRQSEAMPGLAPSAAAHAGSEWSLATLQRRHGNRTGTSTSPRYGTGPPRTPPTPSPTGTRPGSHLAPPPVLDPSAGTSWWWRGPRLGLPPGWECAALSTAGPRASPERHQQRAQASGLPATPISTLQGPQPPARPPVLPSSLPQPLLRHPLLAVGTTGNIPGSPSLSRPQSRPFRKATGGTNRDLGSGRAQQIPPAPRGGRTPSPGTPSLSTHGRSPSNVARRGWVCARSVFICGFSPRAKRWRVQT